MSIADIQAEVQADTPWAPSKHFLNLRPLYFLRWLRHNSLRLCPDDGVAASDEDLVIQGDPFDITTAMPGHALYAFGEKTNFSNADGLNKLYVEMATASENTRAHVLPKQVFCFGFALGEAWAMRELHERLAVAIYTRGYEVSDKQRHALDQGMLNVLIHTNSLDDLKLHRVYNEDPWVAHLTSQLRDLSTFPWGTRRIVHQYKWAKSVRATLKDQYGFDV